MLGVSWISQIPRRLSGCVHLLLASEMFPAERSRRGEMPRVLRSCSRRAASCPRRGDTMGTEDQWLGSAPVPRWGLIPAKRAGELCKGVEWVKSSFCISPFPTKGFQQISCPLVSSWRRDRHRTGTRTRPGPPAATPPCSAPDCTRDFAHVMASGGQTLVSCWSPDHSCAPFPPGILLWGRAAQPRSLALPSPPGL